MKNFNIAMPFVCLSVAFKHLNHETDCYKSGEKILIKLEALTRLNFQFQTVITKGGHANS